MNIPLLADKSMSISRSYGVLKVIMDQLCCKFWLSWVKFILVGGGFFAGNAPKMSP